MLTALSVLLIIIGSMLMISEHFLWGVCLVGLALYVIGKADRNDEARFFGWLFVFAIVAISSGYVLTE
jgi:membrane-bound ClpP family serine protease